MNANRDVLERILYLPGAGGSASFWAPVAQRVRVPAEPVLLGWPGFGDTPPDPAVRCLDDLLTLVLERLDRPSALVAQSMGGVLAMRAALERPAVVRRLVLVATSGGIDLGSLDIEDWRPDYLAEFPGAPRWFVDDRADLTERLSAMRAPVLLLWGDADPLSPPRVGQRLAQLLPDAVLRIIPGGDHAFAHARAEEVASLIQGFLAAG
jgi:pimeloyl-ACP methyl ester carboxylesterase